jgi:heme-degrading monooxygenase HmoA
MKVIAMNHEVADYDAWKAVFDEYPPSKGGALFHRINRSVDDPNNVTVVAGFETADAARAFANDPNLKEEMGRAGVKSAPRIEIYEEVESVQY